MLKYSFILNRFSSKVEIRIFKLKDFSKFGVCVCACVFAHTCICICVYPTILIMLISPVNFFFDIAYSNFSSVQVKLLQIQPYWRLRQ